MNDSDFRPSMFDADPVSGRLYRDRWEKRRTTFRPSSHLDYDRIVRRVDADPAANATAEEIATLIAALEVRYRELGERLKQLKRDHPLARLPGESETTYRKRVPGAGDFPAEARYVLLWLAGERTDVGRAVKALRDGGGRPHRLTGINHNQVTRDLLQPFEQRWNESYSAALAAETACVRARVEATPIDDAGWEQYQQQCDWNDARKEIDAAWSTECKLRGGRPPAGLSASDIFDILNERTKPRAAEITRARHKINLMTQPRTAKETQS